MQIAMPLLHIVIFPGFVFLTAAGLVINWVDRKLVAKFQNRVGPPFFQPLADLIKLLAKEDIIPEVASRTMFTLMPLVGLAGVIASIIYIPLWAVQPINSFDGDLIVVLYLLTLPAFSLFFGGWYAHNPFATVGATRVLTQLFGYEVPFLLACLAPAIAAKSWNISVITDYQYHNGWLVAWVPIAFLVAVISLIGKLERVPFDIPQANTEIVTGPEVEYTGRRLAVIKVMFLAETFVASALIAALFLGGAHFWWIPWDSMPAWAAGLVGMVVLCVKVLAIVFFLALARAALARLRIEQMVQWCLVYLGIPALLQIAFVIVSRHLGA
ncbi:MAG: NADH-quinone oxidoreductase subunit H [Armatimonadetes bacterium]|nr:NADH-quinone oxidoreductase subunit H [Armatimonadota bacterium]